MKIPKSAIRIVPWLCAAGLVSVLAAPPSGRDITLAVETELSRHDDVAEHRVDVTTESGIVTLEGSVDHLLARRAAERIAANILGVRSVVNLLDVAHPSRDDAALRRDIVAALQSDPALEAGDFTVRVQDADVTLLGAVESWAEKALAGDVAAGVHGVQSIQNQVNVRFDKTRSDADIAAEARRMLENDVRLDASGIDLSVDNGVVTLSGEVAGAVEKTFARYDAWVPGAHSVIMTNLIVRPTARETMQRDLPRPRRGDEAVRDAVLAALRHDPRIDTDGLTVSVDAGRVTLRGTVGDVRASHAARETTLNTLGVFGVRNQLRVTPIEDVADLELARRVEQALARDAYLQRFPLRASVRNGRVTLYGSVDNPFEKQRATGLAAAIQGVASVHNNVYVAAVRQPEADWEIRDNIRRLLIWDSRLGADAYTVRVIDGVVTLSGTADSVAERDRVEDLAFRGGARKVLNLVTIPD